MRKNRTTVLCQQCGKPFDIPHSLLIDPVRGKFCSKPCGWAHQHGMKRPRVERVECICKTCGKHFSLTRSNMSRGRGQYCSRSCATEVKRIPVEQRFWGKVNKTETCWLWTGSKGSDGYGITTVGHTKLRASRVSWELANGPIPEGLSVLHHCDTPLCVRPDHLFLGTRADNARDKVTKGRQPRGESHRGAKLTDQYVREIRQHYDDGIFSMRHIGRIYGVSAEVIRRIVYRRGWTHIE